MATSQLTAGNWQLERSARLVRRNPLAAVGVVLVVIFLMGALFAPWIAPQDPAHIDLPNRLEPPSAHHLGGTDELGRDILSRLIWGARISMFVGSAKMMRRWPLETIGKIDVCRILRSDPGSEKRTEQEDDDQHDAHRRQRVVADKARALLQLPVAGR